MNPLRRPDVRAADGGSLWLVPYFVLAGFIFLDGLPVDAQWVSQIELGLFLVPIFFIAISPSEHDFAPLGIIAFGLLNDVLSEAPLGYWAFLFSFFYLLAMGQKGVLQEARVSGVWGNFSVVILITYFAGYLIALLREDMAIDFWLYLFSAFLTALCFPLLYLPLGWMENQTFSDPLRRGDD
jgi:cell shape-determining protein MreD